MSAGGSDPDDCERAATASFLAGVSEGASARGGAASASVVVVAVAEGLSGGAPAGHETRLVDGFLKGWGGLV